MNTPKEKTEVTGEGNASRVKTIWNSDGTDGLCLICAPSFEDVARMAGLPFDGTVEALEAEGITPEDDTRTIGLPANESESEPDDESEGERLSDDGRSFGYGESYAERNA